MAAVPQPGAAEVLVRIDAIAVCATDLEIIKYGPPALRRLYVEACGPDHRDPDAAARAALGVGLGDLLSRWQRWLAG